MQAGEGLPCRSPHQLGIPACRFQGPSFVLAVGGGPQPVGPSATPLSIDSKGTVTMRQLVLKMSISVDGFVGGPGGELDWIFPTYDEGATAWTVDCL
jgi:hypothetical protein